MWTDVPSIHGACCPIQHLHVSTQEYSLSLAKLGAPQQVWERKSCLEPKALFETGYLETCIHSVCHRVFTPDSPKLISRKSLPKIFSGQKNHGRTFCNDVTTTTTTIKQYKHNHNNQFDPIILALPHPITVLLWML